MIGVSEILLIAVMASLLLGPERMPELARSAARTIASWRAELKGMSEQLQEDLQVKDLERELAEVRRELDDIRQLPEALQSAVMADLDLSAVVSEMAIVEADPEVDAASSPFEEHEGKAGPYPRV